MSPNTTPNAPTSSANCAGDRVGATAVSTAIPTPPPLPTSTRRRSTNGDRGIAIAADANFSGQVCGHGGLSRRILMSSSHPGRTSTSRREVFEDQTDGRVRRRETGVRGSAAAQRPDGGHPAAQTGGVGGVLLRPDLLSGLRNGADPAGIGRGWAGRVGHRSVGGAGGDPAAGHRRRVVPTDLLRVPEPVSYTHLRAHE